MLETGINIMQWPSLQYCRMCAFGGDAQRKAMWHRSSFIIIDDLMVALDQAPWFKTHTVSDVSD